MGSSGILRIIFDWLLKRVAEAQAREARATRRDKLFKLLIHYMTNYMLPM
jgi:hypothetical protein